MPSHLLVRCSKLPKSSSERVIILVAYNPSKRHPSKRASCQRVGKKQKATIQAKIQRLELHSIQASDDAPEKPKILKAAMMKLVSVENAISKNFPCDFLDDLQLSIEAYKREIGPSGSVVTFIVAPT